MANQSELQAAHALLTDLMIERATLRKSRRLDRYELTDDLRDDGLRLPLIGSYVYDEAGEVAIDLHEISIRDADRHGAALERLLPGVPVRIRYGRNDDQTAPTKKSDARPLWGGVQMDTDAAFGTLTLVVRKSSKDRTLLSAHVVGVGQTGQRVGQASVDTGGTYGAVTDNPAGPDRKSDSSLASIDKGGINGQLDRIWKAKDTAYVVTGKAIDAQITKGLTVSMQGAFSGPLSTGKVLQTGVTSVRPSGLVLTDQVTADYPAIGGDSGAPVFFPDNGSSTDVIFAGIHVGTHSGAKLFSPWSGIKTDLGL